MRRPVELPTRRCKAHRTDGEPCKLFAIRGGTVCRMHGGRAPQVKRKAAERMHDLVHPAISSLGRLIRQDQFAAVKYVLDWAGFRSETIAQTDTSLTVTVHFDHANSDATLELPAAD